MSELVTAVSTAYIAQAASSAVLAVLLNRFYRHYGREYLGHWAWSWIALAVFQLCSGIGLMIAGTYPADSTPRLFIAAVAGVAGYTQAGWLLFGCYEIVRRRPVRIRTTKIVLVTLAAVGLITSLAFLGGPEDGAGRYFIRFMLRTLVAGTAFLVGGWFILRRRHTPGTLGFMIVAVAFLVYGAQQFHYFGLGVYWMTAGRMPAYAGSLGFYDVVVQTLMGVGMLTSLLEDEREASSLATAQIEHLAYHDALTGLPNRPLFIDRLILAIGQANRAPKRMAIFFLDLDRFKDLNDSLGHSVGDQILKSVAQQIRNCVREGDTVARFGGDEFTLLIEKIDHVEDAAKIAQKILETVKVPIHVGDRELATSTSIGIALYPNDGVDPETLIRNADTAMYRAKEAGRNNFQLFTAAMNAEAVHRLSMEQSLRKAIEQEELRLFYQPLFQLPSHQLYGFEALIRWQHPTQGLLSPAHFISLAEVSGLIIPIGDWVLRTACRQAKSWQKVFGREIRVAVNLSALQFHQVDLVEKISAILKDTGLPAQLLDIEITESNAMQNAENSVRTLLDLKRLGVKISMDDFGTGYSSLSYLKRFPIDTLKLDQSFVRDLSVDADDGAIATAVISMAHTLRLKVVAEGVETESQLDFLRDRFCDQVQGFLFSPPVPVEDVVRFLKFPPEQ